jgi:hypothetical protein
VGSLGAPDWVGGWNMVVDGDIRRLGFFGSHCGCKDFVEASLGDLLGTVA